MARWKEGQDSRQQLDLVIRHWQALEDRREELGPGPWSVTLHCSGVLRNASQLVDASVRLLYGTDLAHTDIPWGIDAQELHLMLGSETENSDCAGHSLGGTTPSADQAAGPGGPAPVPS